MKFSHTELDGVVLIDVSPHEDERGLFARVYCQDLFAAQGLHAEVPQINLSFNHLAGTLRGMHFQRPPHGEVKVVRCVRGAMHDVVIDLRPESQTFRHWLGVDLTADNRRALFIPQGFAHGFQTLEDDTEVLYLMGHRYVPGSGAGVRFNDPAFGIAWPREVSLISERDAAYPDFEVS